MTWQPGDARQLAASPLEMRMASDGNAYTYSEYLHFYGQYSAELKWNSSQPYSAPQTESSDASQLAAFLSAPAGAASSQHGIASATNSGPPLQHDSPAHACAHYLQTLCGDDRDFSRKQDEAVDQQMGGGALGARGSPTALSWGVASAAESAPARLEDSSDAWKRKSPFASEVQPAANQAESSDALQLAASLSGPAVVASSQHGSASASTSDPPLQHTVPAHASAHSPAVEQTESSGASQPAASSPGLAPQNPPSNAPRVAVAISSAPVLLTPAQLDSMPMQPGFGGKAAWQKQRELRQICLQHGTKCIDLSNDDWPWRQVLKSLNTTVAHELVCLGVTAFRFRLLEHVRDHNYVVLGDTGERHVFELERSDGSFYHLHFHKNGRMDIPPKSGSSQNSADMIRSGGVSQPANLTQPGGAGQPAELAYHLGKNEAHLTLQKILEQQVGGWTDVTDETSFHWTRNNNVSLEPRTTTSSWLAPDVAAHQLLRALGPTLSRDSRGNVRRCFSACRSDEGGEAEDYRSCPSTRKG